MIAPSTPSAIAATTDTQRILTEAEMKAFERDNIMRALEATNWKVGGDGGAAKLLGMKPTTLASRMKVMGIARG